MRTNDLRMRWEERARETLARSLQPEQVPAALDDLFLRLASRSIPPWQEEKTVLWTAFYVVQDLQAGMHARGVSEGAAGGEALKTGALLRSDRANSSASHRAKHRRHAD